jgi:catechol 2,3-dioxygenase-like lactoylglutathione lyase family enzyme
MIGRIVFLAILIWSGIAEADKFSRVPLSPGAYSVDEMGDGFCRLGPGGDSLVVESADALSVITIDGAKVHVDRFADGVLRLDGGFEGAALVASGGGQKLTIAPENGAVIVRLGSKPPQKWVRAGSAATRGVATGIGGVFFKAKDAKKLRGWYEQHLGMVASSYGFIDIRWRELAEPFRVARTVWATFKPESTHFDGPFMINYRVDQLDALLKKLEKDGVKIERKEDEPGQGRFAWIRDGEGNLVELWEPPPGG